MTARDIARSVAFRTLHAICGRGRGLRIILLYHSVGGAAPRSVPMHAFEQQMKLLRTRFTIARVCDLEDTAAVSRDDNNIACVTFDDGYRDNYECGLQVLERVGIKATFFIVTDFLGGSFPTFFGPVPMMSIAEVRALAGLGHEIGAHTRGHPRLTHVLPEVARQEIRDSRHLLEDALGAPVPSFAYPKGAYNTAVRTLVSDAGFRVAVATGNRLLEKTPDWLALPRVCIGGETTAPVFAAKISPAADIVARLRRRA